MTDTGNVVLKLYVTNLTPKIENALEKLNDKCDRELNNGYELSVINILENSQMAEDDRVLATPTLIKQLPEPVKRIIGDISNIDKLMVGLGLC